MAAADARGLIVEKGRDGLEVYPVLAGAVLDDEAVTTTPEAVLSGIM